MKKVLSLVIIAIMCLTAVFPAFAAEEFVPSINNKPTPDIEGKVVIKKDNEIIEEIDLGGLCLVVTPVSEAKTSTLIPDAAEEELLYVYEQLSSGAMVLPYEKVDASIDPSKMVIRDLFDASWLCEEHPEIVAPAGVVVELTFDLGVAASTDVIVMTYKNNEWNPIASVTNNGDGTVTCVFEDFCPIAFAVPTSEYREPVETGDTSPSVMVWVAVMAAAAIAIAALLIFRRKAVK